MDYRDEMKGKHALITGGLGFIGSNLAHALVAGGAKVTIVDSLRLECGGNRYNVEDIEGKITVHTGDIGDRALMDEAVKRKHIIFNLAGHVSHLRSFKKPEVDLEINCLSQLQLLEACRIHNPEAKIIYTGSRGQYGKPQRLPVDEDHPLNPLDVNGINKTAGEQYHLFYHRLYGMHTTSLRLTNTYGPRHCMHTPEQGFLSWFIRQAIDDETITIYGDGSQLRDFNYVTDVVDALWRVATSPNCAGEVFNVGSSESVNAREVTEMLLRIAGSGRYENVPYPAEKQKIEIGDYRADISKIKNLTGWEPQVSLEKGLEETIRFYRREKDHYWK